MPFAKGLYYTVSGDPARGKLPIILLHGAGSDHLCWPLHLRRLRGYRVIALDLPGHGRSEGVALHSVEAYARSVIEFMNAMGIYRVLIVGHSLGGAIALMTAFRFPDRVTAIGMIASGARLPLPKPLLKLLDDPNWTPKVLAFLESHLFAPATRRDLITRVMKGLYQAKPEVLVSDWRAASNFDLCNELSNIDQPVWLATGSADLLTPPMLVAYLQRHLPHAVMQIIPDAGHMVLLERPGILAESLCSFLDSLPYRLGDFS